MRHFLPTLLVFFSVTLFSYGSLAGVTELSLSTNYRNQKIDSNNFTNSLSYTGSISYYFWEMSALELSYTKGESKQSFRLTGDTESTVATTEFELIGVDFVLSFAERKAAFQPFVKVGAAHIDKVFLLDPAGGTEAETGSQSGIAPSAGVGMRIRFTQTFSLKMGVDAWASPINDDSDDPETVDYAGRVGISWMF
ncbi:MAG: hypothetical protein CL677_04530 [Bdellovibrionaceae bacterium]|nr:hypothetical protein [Pseudobdellovibrionaceae bacterium]